MIIILSFLIPTAEKFFGGDIQIVQEAMTVCAQHNTFGDFSIEASRPVGPETTDTRDFIIPIRMMKVKHIRSGFSTVSTLFTALYRHDIFSICLIEFSLCCIFAVLTNVLAYSCFLILKRERD